MNNYCYSNKKNEVFRVLIINPKSFIMCMLTLCIHGINRTLEYGFAVRYSSD